MANELWVSIPDKLEVDFNNSPEACEIGPLMSFPCQGSCNPDSLYSDDLDLVVLMDRIAAILKTNAEV